jgi:beta-alanine degradation protein BauB
MTAETAFFSGVCFCLSFQADGLAPLRSQLTTGDAMSNDTPASGPIGSRILYEDAQVRIWDMTLEPGTDSGRHEHRHPYVIVMVEGDRVGLHEHVALDGGLDQYREADVVVGAAISLPSGGIETAVNVGSARYRDIQIELL